MHNNLAEIKKILEISPVEAAVKWVLNHSALHKGDEIFLGASKEMQIARYNLHRSTDLFQNTEICGY